MRRLVEGALAWLVAGARVSKTLCALTLLTTLGLCLVAAVTLGALRDDAWERASASSNNILRLVELDVERNIEMFDLSLSAVTDGLVIKGLDEFPPELRQAVLFDRSTTARYLGAILVLDRDGNVRYESRTPETRHANYRARDYFQHHLQTVDPGLYISRPYMSSTTGEMVVGLSRRLVTADGSFDGVIVGTMQLGYFRDLFAKLDVGPNGRIALFRRDGTLLTRSPFVEGLVGRSFTDSPTYRAVAERRHGSMVTPSSIDGVARHITFGRVGTLPLFVTVAMSVEDILADWWRKALAIAAVVVCLCCLTLLLNLLLLRELRRRAEAEANLQHANERYARLAMTDPLTGLGNRRLFDETLLRSWREAGRASVPVALIMVDADHFKAFNDHYGHAGGDAVLRRIADRLDTVSVEHALEPCRIGGEEFGLLLVGRGESEAVAVAEAVRTGVEADAIPHVGSPHGTVSVSLGVAALTPAEGESPSVLLEAADAALYRAKALGRNRTAVLGPSSLADALVSIAPRSAPVRRRRARTA